MDKFFSAENSLKTTSLVSPSSQIAFERSEDTQFHEKDDIQSVTTDLGVKDSLSRCSLNSRFNSHDTTGVTLEPSEAIARSSSGFKGMTQLMTGAPTQKDYFIPGLFRHRSSYLESMEDYQQDFPKSPTNFPKEIKVLEPMAENSSAMSSKGLPARSIKTDEGETPGFASKIQYRFPHMIGSSDGSDKVTEPFRICTPKPMQPHSDRDHAACELLKVEDKSELRFPSFDSSSDSWDSDSEAQEDNSEDSDSESEDDNNEVPLASLGKRKPLKPTGSRLRKVLKL